MNARRNDSAGDTGAATKSAAVLPDYAELHCLSYFTFLRGASSPLELMATAREQGYRALAITDECSVAGVVQAWQAQKDLLHEDGLAREAAPEATEANEADATNEPFAEPGPMPKLIVGSEFRFECGLKLVVLAQSREGYGNLSALISLGRRNAQKGEYRLTRGDLGSLPPAKVLPDCLVIWLPGEIRTEADAAAQAADGQWLRTRLADRLWIGVALLCGPDDEARLATLRTLGATCELPLVAAGDVHMHVRSHRALQDTVTAIRLRTTVFEAGAALYPNGERHLRKRLRLSRLYPPELLAETVKIAERCNFDLGVLGYEYPDEIVPAGHTLSSYLRQETEIGLIGRYPADRYPEGIPQKVLDDVEKELALIAEKKYEAFFLTVYDIVKFARSVQILCQGRGSAANSAVCYALGITEVDPMSATLLFERFISRERDEPPDIDVDFEHERREEVIQHIYGKYGRERAALAATVIRYRRKSALRDVGAALGFGEAQISALSRSLAWWDQPDELPDRLREIGFSPDSPRIQKWLMLTAQLQEAPRHLSQHVGGFVISRGPLARLVPIENAAMADRSVIQWDKDDLESLGLLKVDVLALGMLTVIRRALNWVSILRGRTLKMFDVLHGDAQEDAATYDMICKADTVGVFQIESRAQMSMLPRLKPRKYYDLVVQVAIVRPGPIQGGMVHPFLAGHKAGKALRKINADVDAVLDRTFGVPIFQEQVMQLAVVAADFTPGEADQLRRAMASWKKKGHLERFKDKLRAGMKNRGLEKFAEDLCRQIEGFGEYGFPESHAASFALLAYVSAWLKCHEPAAFLCALLNSQPMGFYQPAQLVQDARAHGVEVLAADVHHSRWESVLDCRRGEQPAVRLGLREIQGFNEEAAQRVVRARGERGFADEQDLAVRAALNAREMNCLVAADALATLSGHRRQAAWQVSGMQIQGDLFDAAPPPEEALHFAAPTEGQSILADYANLGLTLRRHPLALLRPRLAEHRFVTARELHGAPDRAPARTAGLVTCRQKPGSAKSVFVTLEDETGVVNVIVHPWLADRQRRELLTAQFMGVYGLLQVQEDGVMLVIAKRLLNLSPWIGSLQTVSRNFH